jgi:hypothetical protein
MKNRVRKASLFRFLTSVKFVDIAFPESRLKKAMLKFFKPKMSGSGHQSICL